MPFRVPAFTGVRNRLCHNYDFESNINYLVNLA